MRRFGTCITRIRRNPALPLTSSKWHLRGIHTPAPLQHRLEEGLGEFLPPSALRTVAVEYQQGLLDNLNDEVRGTDLEGMSVVDTIIKTSVERSKVLAFNYASLALNNHFFVAHLKSLPRNASDHQNEISLQLEGEIRRQHGSLAQLKSTFSAAATGMFTNGWVWLVTDAAGNLAVLPTFGPGTLLVRSRTYMAPTIDPALERDMLLSQQGVPLTPDDPFYDEYAKEMLSQSGNEENAPSSVPPASPTPKNPPPGVAPSSPASGVSGHNNAQAPQNPLHPRFLHTSAPRRQDEFEDQSQAGIYDTQMGPIRAGPSRTELYNNMGEQLFPLFCLSVHEHAWISAGYGVWGKEEWLKKFWTVLDWERVSQNYAYYMTTATKRAIAGDYDAVL